MLHFRQAKGKDLVTQLQEYEEGKMNQQEVTELFQELVNNGMAWQLQGCYGRTAQALLDAGIIRQAKV